MSRPLWRIMQHTKQRCDRFEILIINSNSLNFKAIQIHKMQAIEQSNINKNV